LAGGPFASKDIDLLGDAGTVRACARKLNVRPHIPAMDHATPEAGRLVYVLDGRECDIDFLDRSAPNSRKEVEATAVPITRSWGTLWIMHPLACMKSRVFNVIQIPSKYDTPHGREQLAASIT